MPGGCLSHNPKRHRETVTPKLKGAARPRGEDQHRFAMAAHNGRHGIHQCTSAVARPVVRAWLARRCSDFWRHWCMKASRRIISVDCSSPS